MQIKEFLTTSSKYTTNIFSKDSIERVNEALTQDDEGRKWFLNCKVRNKKVQAKPEEIIRQLVLDKLITEYNYPVDFLQVEYSVSFGREKKLADIVILNKQDKTSVYCVIEVKKLTAKDGKAQLRSYVNATGAPLAVWTNGTEIDVYERLDPNYFEPLSDLPKADQTIDDIKDESFTYLDLMRKDRLIEEKKSLKNLILEMEDEVLANAGVDVFEEVFKLIFIKLYDEMESAGDREYIEREMSKKPDSAEDKEALSKMSNEGLRQLEFRSRGDAHDTQDTMKRLFEKAKTKWHGVFDAGEPIRITDVNHLQICVSFLQNVKLFNSNLQVIDEAFEYLVNKSSKGEKGQYFTPRNVIDMAVYMLNPQPSEYMIDTACGSCGFTVHTLFNVWQKLVNNGKAHFSNFSNQTLTSAQKAYVDKVFGIDFDEKSIRVARTLNMIAGDGHTNVLHLNSLDYTRWEEKMRDPEWSRNYLQGYYRLLDLAKDRKEPKEFNFDIVMANPPFAGDIRDQRLLANFSVASNDKKQADKISRDILFIERNLDFLKPGGRIAIVLPQGRFNNTSDQKIRDFIMERARLIAVIGLDVNTFKPHTGTKTSVLFIQKWDEDKDSATYNPKKDDYPIFMAVSENSGKDSSGNEIYKTDENGERELNEYNHLIQKHDLKSIAHEFEKWAKEQKLSFWSKYN